MSYTLPTIACLGAGKTGLTGTMGYRITDSNGTVTTAYTRTNVAETAVPGNYIVTGGVTHVDNFIGVVEWGTSSSGPWLASEDILPPATVNVALTISGNGVRSVTFTLTDNLGSNVASAALTITNTAGTTVYAIPALTDANGQTSCSLNDGTYKVLVQTSPTWEAFAPQTLVVDGTETASYTLTRYVPVGASDPAKCLVYGTLLGISGGHTANVPVTFKLRARGPVVSSGQFVQGSDEQEVKTNASGYFSVELIRSVNLSPVSANESKEYNVLIPSCNINKYITVPDQASVDITSLIN